MLAALQLLRMLELLLQPRIAMLAAQVVQVLRLLLRRNQAAQPAQSLAVQPLEPQIIMLASLKP